MHTESGAMTGVLRATLLPLLLIVLTGGTHAQTAEGSGSLDSMAVRTAVMDYVDGWWTGDAGRMAKSLHPDLVKRIVFTHPNSGRSMLNSVSRYDMVEYTSAGGGSKDADGKGEVECDILAMEAGIATVRATSGRFIDYLHLVKWNGEWVILNVLWAQR